ncbi:MAG TPA: HAD-IA family hydrolase [Gemmatimonadaceae bacterium]|nr:HAD-IA family hydrolase [Gemmatimonadaceae bacterium]
MASPPRPAPVLFDLDGTLIDSIDLIVKSAQFAFLKCDIECPTDAEWLAGVGRPLPVMFGHFAPGREQELIAAYREFQLANHDLLVRVYDGVPEMLGELAAWGHPMAIVTSKSNVLALRGLVHTGIDQYFEHVVGMDSCQRHKPDPEPVRIALDRLSRDPEGAWFVGDSVHDMESGNAAGVQTVGALWGPFGAEDLAPSRPRHLAGRPNDVISLIVGN